MCLPNITIDITQYNQEVAVVLYEGDYAAEEFIRRVTDKIRVLDYEGDMEIIVLNDDNCISDVIEKYDLHRKKDDVMAFEKLNIITVVSSDYYSNYLEDYDDGIIRKNWIKQKCICLSADLNEEQSQILKNTWVLTSRETAYIPFTLLVYLLSDGSEYIQNIQSFVVSDESFFNLRHVKNLAGAYFELLRVAHPPMENSVRIRNIEETYEHILDLIKCEDVKYLTLKDLPEICEEKKKWIFGKGNVIRGYRGKYGYSVDEISRILKNFVEKKVELNWQNSEINNYLNTVPYWIIYDERFVDKIQSLKELYVGKKNEFQERVRENSINDERFFEMQENYKYYLLLLKIIEYINAFRQGFAMNNRELLIKKDRINRLIPAKNFIDTNFSGGIHNFGTFMDENFYELCKIAMNLGRRDEIKGFASSDFCEGANCINTMSAMVDTLIMVKLQKI